jgi:hypothetical protein
MLNETALRYHLEHNLYPPIVATGMAIKCCKAAIRLCASGLDDSTVCGLPASKVVEDLHLDEFVDQESASESEEA